MAEPEDDRWEWIEVTQFGDPCPMYLRGRCNHKTLIPVRNLFNEELIAWLCWDCDMQLPPEWKEEPE